MDHIKEESLDEEELISVIEIEEHYIKPDPLCTDAMQETLEEQQFAICPPEQVYIYELAPVNDTKQASMAASSSLQPNQAKIPCGKNFGGLAYLDHHIRIMHQLQCPQCDSVLSSKAELSNHLYSHPHPCELCSQMHQTFDQLKQHGLDIHGVQITKQFIKNNLVSNFKCMYCNEKFSTKSLFELHRTPILDEEFQCCKCDSFFITACRLCRHIRFQCCRDLDQK